MNLVGKEVFHEKFGRGRIVSLEKSRIEVEFDSCIKKFIYPEVFDRFMSLVDDAAQKYVKRKLAEADRQKKLALERKYREAELMERIHSLKIHPVSQAAFGLIENELDTILETWKIFTGRYLTGGSKGEPRIPQRMNINSACLLTWLPQGAVEEERIIYGAFMVDDNFVGKECDDGIIPAHESYRIILKPEKEKMLFWDYYSTESGKKRWGNCEIKYLSNVNMQEILRDMVKIIKDRDRKKKAEEFYSYFCNLNRLLMK